MSARLGVKMQGRSGYGSMSKALAASKAGRAAKKSLRRSAALVAPAVKRTGGYSFRAMGGKELNFVDTTLSSSAISTTPYLALLNGMAQGTTASTRIGRRIQMKSLEVKGWIQADSTATVNQVRWVVVLDKQANATAPAWLDVYDAAVPYSLRNISNKARFWVLHDSGLLTVTGNNTTAGQQTDCSLVPIEFYKRINIPVQYNSGSAGTIGDIQTNSLYFMAIGLTASGTADCQLNGTFRIRYDDQ